MSADNHGFCLMLRTKSGYFRSQEGERMIHPDSTTACYVCLVTQHPFGPDGMPVDPASCGSARACFKAET
jgi:hypothetical protein